MSNMKCPICQNNLHKINIIVSTCTNDKCKLWGSSIPNLVLGALAQAKQDLERTHKALDKAKNGLKELKDIIACPPDVSYETCVSMYADGVLQEITTLEQKGVK